jgi:pimeloyl-ACP methyl ester carboxylesterase
MYRTFLMHELLPWARGTHDGTRLEPSTLLLVGAEDPVIRPGVIAGYEQHSRDMRAEFVPGAGHFLPEERPELVLARALEFFADER